MSEEIHHLEKWTRSLDRNQNSYKMVLALSLLKAIRRGQTVLGYDQVISDFVQFYWNQALTYKIRHTTSTGQIPLVIQKIKEVVPKDLHSIQYRFIKRTHPQFIKEIEEYIQLNPRIIRNPISRFQVDYQVKNQAEGDKEGNGWLYAWSEDNWSLKFDSKVSNQIYPHWQLFRDEVILKTTRFLEKYNALPRLTQKIDITTNRPAIPNRIQQYFVSANECFYCGKTLSDGKFHLDHFIPWEYIVSHDAWNLVPSCPECNNGTDGKFIKLPKQRFLIKLMKRNEKFYLAGLLKQDFVTREEMNEKIEFHYSNALKCGYSIWGKRLPPS